MGPHFEDLLIHNTLQYLYQEKHDTMENITLIGGKALIAVSPNDRARTGKVLEVE